MAIAPPPPAPNKAKAARQPPVRLVGWGGAATLALAALALTLQSEAGSERLQTAFAPAEPPQVVAKAEPRAEPAVTAERDAETKRLEALVLALANDRERQSARIAALEHSLEDVTGSIKQQVERAAKSLPPPPPAVPTILPLSMPAISAPATTGWPGSQSQTEPPPGELVPLPPARVVATLPATEAASEEAPRKPEIGVDLGGAANLDVLNARWVAVKANFGPMLSGLYARAAERHRANGSDYRLIAGPLPTNAAAVQLCAKLVAVRVTCRAVKFDGERLVQR